MRVTTGPTIGVLVPFVGSKYFGAILTGLADAAAGHGGRVVAIQTLDAGSQQTELPQPPDFRQPIGWHRMSAFIAITNAVDGRYLRSLQDAGKPVVMVSHEYPDVACPCVVPDNRGGVRQTVAHLVAHGHREIAFAGYLGVYDIRERYEAYREALREHGIEPDPALYFDTGNNFENGGDMAARQMLAAGLPSTATVVATDANAVGMLRTLTAAGCRLPRDQALVGFDDIATARYTAPSLSSVRQPTATIGATAVDLVVRQLAGEAVAPGRHLVSTTLIVRESCGCPPPPDHPAAPDAPATGERPALAAAPVVAHEVASSQALLADVGFLQDTLNMQYEVSMGLLRSHEEDPRRLAWLSRTRAHAGCLGLWSESDPEPGTGTAMEIAGVFQRDNGADVVGLAALTGRRLGVAEFPPRELLAVADGIRGAIVFVIPVRTDERDWGMFALAGGIEIAVPTGRETPNQWGGLLTVALHHQSVLGSLRAREEQLRRAALYDRLTGLPNRTLFLDRLTQALNRSRRRSDYHFAVFFLDLDGFKVVNDSMGHSVGDRLLVQVSERVRSLLRDSDTVARFGGDEFLILLDGLESERMPTEVAERLHRAVAHPFHLQGQDVVVTATIGIALSAGRYDNAEDVLRDADIAMYWAKFRGQGSHAVFDVAMHARAVHRLQMEADLRRALDQDEFELHYQPIVNVQNDRTRAFEALIRWRHPDRGLLPPAEFLPIAEESGLMLPIGRWVTQAACRQIRDWQGYGPIRVSVNISNRQFWHEDLLDEIDSWLADSGVDPGCLALEITEGVIMYNVDAACKTLEALHDRGMELHIDDFGTGYSSLEALHRLPLDALKIDRSFVSRLDTDPRSWELVRTIVMMGDNLGLDLIAEGIETERQRDRIQALGCEYGQGYLFSRPVPPGSAASLISPDAAES